MHANSIASSGSKQNHQSDGGAAISLEGWYKFSPSKMLKFMGALVGQPSISRSDGAKTIGVQSADTFQKYERFLRSGNLAMISNDTIRATALLKAHWPDIANGAPAALAVLLESVPGFRTLHQYVAKTGNTTLSDAGSPVPRNARTNYFALGEAAGLWCSLGGEQLVATPTTPGPSDFSSLALDAYYRIRGNKDSEWVLSGEWLELLASDSGVHPIVVRSLLQQARDRGNLRVFAEGSTPDTRFDKHRIWVLRTSNETPYIDWAYLYRGDFLTPGTASVRIVLQGVEDAP